MNPQSTTPCYVRIDDNGKFKEVCNKLYQSGYSVGQMYIDALDNTIITYPEISNTFCTGSDGQFDEIDTKGRIDCGTNIPLFLDLAGMWSDTYKNQLCIDERDGSMNLSEDDDIGLSALVYRRATATEIIE